MFICLCRSSLDNKTRDLANLEHEYSKSKIQVLQTELSRINSSIQAYQPERWYFYINILNMYSFIERKLCNWLIQYLTRYIWRNKYPYDCFVVSSFCNHGWLYHAWNTPTYYSYYLISLFLVFKSSCIMFRNIFQLEQLLVPVST